MVRLSLAWGVPLREVRQLITSAEWSVYEAADRLGMCGEPACEDDTQSTPEQLNSMYERRKAVYGSRK